MDQIEKGAPRSARDARAPYPSTPVRQFSFTNFSTNNPTTPQPGNNLDSEYDRSNASTAQIITWASVALNTDGTLRDQIVGSNNLVSGLFDDISQGIIDDVQPLVDQATAASSAALSSSHTAQAAATAADTSNAQAQGAASTASVAASTATAAVYTAQAASTAAGNYATNAENAANDAEGAEAIASDYAVLTQAWAEHMPDTIPPNILAVMGVTGDHWSSRWWANKAEAAFGSLTSLYLGVWPAPPTHTPTGDPIPIGAIYYDSTTQQPYVWDGTQWVPFHSPSKAYLLTLLYHATANQTTFPLTTLDLGGNSYTLSTHTPEPIDVYVNGDRLPQDAPNPGYGYWNLDPATSTVTFLSPLTAGATVQIDIMAPPSSLAPSRVQTQALLDFNIDPSTGNPGQIDGVRKTFNLALADRSSLTVGSAQELFVSLDGVVQQPGTDFNTSSTTITFTDAPIIGARSWGMWYGPGLTSSGPGSGYLPISGGTLTGPLTLSGPPTLSLHAASKSYVDSTTATSIGVVNVKSVGAKGDGVTDDTAAIRTAVAAGNCVVYFPPGTYLVSGYPVIVHSHTRILGAGREVSVIRPNGLTAWSFPGGMDAIQVFAGYVYSQIGPYSVATVPPGGVYDTDIAIEGLGFDFTQQGACVASFSFTQRLTLAGLKLWATAGSPCTNVRCIGCDRVTLRDSVADNIVQMLDCWGGSTRIKVSDVDVVMFPGGGNGAVFNLQGVGTVNGSSHSYQYEATNINVQMSGGGVFFLDSQGGGSITSDVLLENINVVATGGSNNQPLVGRGRGGRVKVHNMNCMALSGAAWNNPILIGGYYSFIAIETGPNKVSTQSGSNILTITFTNGTDAGPGNYVNIGASAGGPLVGNGLTLTGTYKILSVVSTMAGNLNQVVTADARANATATGVIATSTNIIGYLGSFHNCELNGITFDGAQTVGQPVISIAGYGHQISNFNVTTNYGASTTPQYSVLIATDGSSEPTTDVTQRAIRLDNIEGAPGAGPISAGYSGDTFLSWNPFVPKPMRDMTEESASATPPVMAGTAAAGTSPAYARGDHVHPTDTSRAAVSALSSYLPLTGGTVTGATTFNATVTAGAGYHCGSQLVSSASDFSKHFDIYNGQFGISLTNDTYTNYVAGGGHRFYQSATQLGTWTTSGLVLTAGAFRCGISTVSSTTDFSKHIDLYNTQAGINITSDTYTNYACFAGHNFIDTNGVMLGRMNPAGITSAAAMQVGGTAGPTWTTGSAVPAATAPVGSLYSRTGGAVGATLYVSRGAGTWASVAGV